MSCKTSFSFLAGNLAAPITTQSQPQLVRLNPPARNTSRDSDDTIIAASGEDATTANSRKTLVRMPYDGTELVGVGPSRTRLLAPSSQSLDFHPKLRSSILSPIMFFNIFSTFSVKESTNGATKPGMQPKPGQPTATRNKKPPALGRVLKALKPPISKTRAGTFQIASTSGSSNSRPSSSSARHPLFPSQPIATTSYPSLTDDPRSSLQSSVIFTMKVLAIIAIVLAYGPVIFDLAVTGRAVIQPTRTSITDPALSHFYTLHMDKPSPVIPPTGLIRRFQSGPYTASPPTELSPTSAPSSPASIVVDLIGNGAASMAGGDSAPEGLSKKRLLSPSTPFCSMLFNIFPSVSTCKPTALTTPLEQQPSKLRGAIRSVLKALHLRRSTPEL
ncbi:hypothetical protein FRC05_000413 [Tulasnella sp. 425]|nr:hypothetical protein FRC05_000413 [Tulasnella sp. 425]